MSPTTQITARAPRRAFIAWAAGAALALGLPAMAQAQPRDGRHDGRGGPQQPPRHRPGQTQSRPGHAQQRPPQARPHSGPPPHAQARQRPWRGSGPQQRWHRGDRVPARYRGRQYVVNNWRAHHLNAPPRGYHWVQYGSDYLLVAIATGVIAQLILSR
ncbi:hypothetical protein GCM10022279_32170 [Comamonas faecalis]|uniref:RcnB family protein n=1 Tax=Comamonas faecalis TaxID=1387849 RepID=A0ABP7S2A2_9BURK